MVKAPVSLVSASQNQRNWPYLGLIALMAVLFYYPVLFESKSQIHAEGVSLGIALMQMLSTALKGETGMLWTTSIYGGHPVFAEGQGGFANPFHLLFAWLLPPVPGYNVHQFVSMLLSGIGAFGMCRASGCGRAASTFAALALLLSTLWIGGRSNIAVGSTMAWIPWALWAMTTWFRRSDLPAACFFGTVMALMVLSGYPQLVHGVLIYIVIYFAVLLSAADGRLGLLGRLKPLASTLVLAILFCIGLSAVQWLPLLELAGESHRSSGIAIGSLDGAPAITFLRGFLFTLPDPDELPNATAGTQIIYFSAIGSLLVCLVFSFIFLFRRSHQANGHLVATIFMILLSMGNRGTPAFQFLYDNHLIPGLHNFRVTFVYLYVALVGFVLVSAIALDRLAGAGQAGLPSWRDWYSRSGLAGRWIFAAWACFWPVAIWYLRVEEVPQAQYYIAAGWLLCVGIALTCGFQKWLPMVALLLLCFEILLLRIDAYDFGESRLIAKPESIETLERENSLQDFKFADRTWANTYSFYPPKSANVVWGLERMLASVTPAANALWGVSSLTGNTALPLRRRTLADPLIDEELRPSGRRTPGLRLVDFVSLRYLAVGESFDNAGFLDAYSDRALKVRIVENLHAYPRFQFFNDTVVVATPEEAVIAIGNLADRKLVVEAPRGISPVPASGALPQGEASFDLVTDRSDKYEFEIRTREPAWFFLADANYPGWHGYLDGRETLLYSAQLLGKAVFVPAGNHALKIAYEPLSFRLGLGLTLITGLSMLLFAVHYVTRRRSRVGVTTLP